MTNKNQTLISFTLIFCIIVALCSFVMANDGQFIHPMDKTVISLSEVTVIGKAVGNGNFSLSIENSSGKSEHGLTPVGNYFSLKIQLVKGRNRISLSTDSGISETIEIMHTDKMSDFSNHDDFIPYYLHSTSDLTEECALCHPGNAGNINQFKYVNQQSTCITGECHPNFKKGKFLHGPLKKKGSCVQCHNPHGSENRNFVKYSGGDLCFTCHTDAERMAREAKYVHFPVKKGECTSCHDPHKSNLEYHLRRGSIAELCAGCHGKDKISHKVLHTPVQSGDCIACHTPHISENKGLLSETGTALCFKCHNVRKEEFNSKYVHEPARKNCIICHDPHGSATIYHLRNRKDENGNYIPVEQPFQELCLSCHRLLDPEIADQIEHSKVKHDPVAQGKCTICHTPHSTNNKKQLKAPLKEICFSCHQKMKELINGSVYKHDPIHSSGCAQCHLPHGSQNRKLLRSKFSEKYADTFNMENFALCFNCHSPDMVLKKESKSTDFRNGKKNLHYLHVNRKKKSRNCKTCHDIHASDQEKHIREKIPFQRRFTITLKFKKTATGGGCAEGCHKPRQYDRITPVISR